MPGRPLLQDPADPPFDAALALALFAAPWLWVWAALTVLQ